MIAALCIYIIRIRAKFNRSNERVINAVAEQLFDSWPVSVIILDLQGNIYRVNKQALDELQLEETAILGKPVTSIIEVKQNRDSMLPAFLKEIAGGKARTMNFPVNSFVRVPQKNVRFLVQGALEGIYMGGRLVRQVLYYRDVLEERTQQHVLNIALSRMPIFQWSYELERNVMVIAPRYFDYLGIIPPKDYTLTSDEFAELVHPDDRKRVFDALAGQLNGVLNENAIPYRLHRGDGTWEWFEVQSTYVGQIADLPFRVAGICMSTQKHKDIEDKLNEALKKRSAATN